MLAAVGLGQEEARQALRRESPRRKKAWRGRSELQKGQLFCSEFILLRPRIVSLQACLVKRNSPISKAD
jgi:hypothetical protein